MKKYLTVLTAFLMLFSCAACGGDNSAPAETASVTQAVSATEQTSDETTAEQTTETTSNEETIASASPEESTARKTEIASGSLTEMGELTQKLYDRIKNNKGQVEMKMSQISEEMPDMKVDIDVIVADKKLRFVMDCGKLFTMTMIGDGKVNYLLDDENKLYCKMDQNDEENPMTAENTPLLNEDGLGKYLGSGKADFKGVQRTYEEYLAEADDDDETDMNTRYYYDDNGDLIGFSTKKDGKEEVMDFSIIFSDQVRDNLFTLPAGYKEGNAQEVIASVYGKMFAALLGGLEDLDLSGGLFTTTKTGA